ncbi:hypothetical protein B0H14DRAFT_3481262 [Mycena olivaceomarginata]|nr:hypothetical protein B0H14DRAFT_3481262 [Mycena olivaceomarginata]
MSSSARHLSMDRYVPSTASEDAGLGSRGEVYDGGLAGLLFGAGKAIAMAK